MKILFWILVICGIAWAFYMAANAPKIMTGQNAGAPNPNSLESSNSNTNIWEVANERVTEVSSNAVNRMKDIEISEIASNESLDRAGLALKSLSHSMIGFFGGIARDGWIISFTRTKLVQKYGPDMYQIEIESKKGIVTLRGLVENTSIRSEIVDLVKSTRWVEAVNDKMTLKN